MRAPTFLVAAGVALFLATQPLRAQPKPATLEAVMEKLKSGKSEEKLKAAQELGKRGAAAKPAARLLCEVSIHNVNPEVPAAARAALAKVRPDLRRRKCGSCLRSRGRNRLAPRE
jgi:hypothetical protein